jgi:hypothetical protein
MMRIKKKNVQILSFQYKYILSETKKRSRQLLLTYCFKVLHHDTRKRNRTDKDLSRGDI